MSATPFRLRTLADADDAPSIARCGCGRQEPADMMADVSMYSAAEREARGWARTTTHVCSACRLTAERTGALAPGELHARQSGAASVAPPPLA